jgi:hypothetical protein
VDSNKVVSKLDVDLDKLKARDVALSLMLNTNLVMEAARVPRYLYRHAGVRVRYAVVGHIRFADKRNRCKGYIRPPSCGESATLPPSSIGVMRPGIHLLRDEHMQIVIGRILVPAISTRMMRIKDVVKGTEISGVNGKDRKARAEASLSWHGHHRSQTKKADVSFPSKARLRNTARSFLQMFLLIS